MLRRLRVEYAVLTLSARWYDTTAAGWRRSYHVVYSFAARQGFSASRGFGFGFGLLQPY